MAAQPCAHLIRSVDPNLGRAGDPLLEHYVQLPLILIAFLRAEGWSVAAYPSKADARAWCVKVKKVCVVNIDADGGLSFKNMSLADRRAIEAIRDRARTAFDGLIQSRDE